jgi:RNA polymerase sigma factor (sigma-70 family)
MASNLEQYVKQAKNGDRQALETVVSRIQEKIYGLALRMLGNSEDAEDETQEILIKVITHLSNFREESAFTSWVYRVACNHLLRARKRKNEREGFTFDFLEDLISKEAGNTYPLTVSGPERALMLEEARLDCLQAVLTCLEKKFRIVVILADIFGVTSAEGAYILDMTPEAFRKRLSRGRERIHHFMMRHCGLVNKNNACRCEKKAGRDLHWGVMDPQKSSLVDRHEAAKIRTQAMADLKELSEIERTTALFRNYPKYRSPESFKNIVKDLVNSGKYRVFMA